MAKMDGVHEKQVSHSTHDVILINLEAPDGSLKEEFSTEPLGLESIGAYLEQEGFSVLIIDMGLSSVTDDDLRGIFLHENPLVIGFSLTQFTLEQFVQLRKVIPEGTTVVAGGIFPTLAFEELLRNYDIDAVVRGEGELAMVEICHRLREKRSLMGLDGIAILDGDSIFCGTTRPLLDLNNILLPLRTFTKTGIAGIEGSRGCPWGRCTFCTTAACAGNKPSWRPRSVKMIVNEMTSLRDSFGISSFFFVDDCFFGNDPLGRAKELSDEIHKAGLSCSFSIDCRANQVDEQVLTLLRDAGLRYLYVGVEAGSPAFLKELRKGISVHRMREIIALCRRLGVSLRIGFITFSHDMPFDRLKEQLFFLLELPFFQRNLFTNILFPLYGTEIHQKVSPGILNPRLRWHDSRVAKMYDFLCRLAAVDCNNPQSLYDRAIPEALRVFSQNESSEP